VKHRSFDHAVPELTPRRARLFFHQEEHCAMSHTVLVVDDDPGVLDVIVDMLEDLGCAVISSRSGADALERLKQNQDISILITDINMPGMDGHELAELARRDRPELKILQLSGREPRRDGLPMIRKPFSFEELASTMQRTTGIC
jgi:CheY-like chemotaxis protein